MGIFNDNFKGPRREDSIEKDNSDFARYYRAHIAPQVTGWAAVATIVGAGYGLYKLTKGPKTMDSSDVFSKDDKRSYSKDRDHIFNGRPKKRRY